MKPPGRPDGLAGLSTIDAGSLARAGVVLVVPLGATEQHGAHLPLSTDTVVAVELCRRLTEVRTDVVVAPAVPYGSSGEHAGFAGTISIGQQALELLLVELVRSATDTFDHVLLVSGHGGNAVPLSRAVATLRSESRHVGVFLPRWDGDPHAGRPETSMVLAIEPESVQMDRAVAGDTRPLAEILPTLQQSGVRGVTATGVLGDPSGASADEGERLLERLTADLVSYLDRWRDGAR